MSTKAIFEKAYGRDTTLIFQQGWIYTNLEGIRKLLGYQNPCDPFVIYYMDHGAIEIWEDVRSEAPLKEFIKSEWQKRPEFIANLLRGYDEHLSVFSAVWEKGVLSNKEEIVSFVEEIFQWMPAAMVMFYSAMDDVAPAEHRDYVRKLRSEDKYFDNNDHVLRESLKKVFPELAEYPTTILKEELSGEMPSPEVCAERWNHFVMLPGGRYFVGALREFAEKNSEYEFKFDKIDPDTTAVQGQVAFPGVVRGRVRVVKLKEKAKEVEDGEIIVAPMTTPALEHAMKRAAAFVTDEGGVTCHAAIIAREMKKPCITGTKIATQVLKDGDMVEVDAERGMVKIIR